MGSAYTEVDPYPLDLLGAQTDGMIGYLLQQELGNELPFEKRLASLLTLVEVDRNDPAFGDPTKPIGPVYGEEEAETLAEGKGWVFKPDGDGFRRVVPSPLPQRIFGIEPVQWLLEHDSVVICAGGGGIPVMYTNEPAPAGRRLVGVEAVIDKDLASALLAYDLAADALAIVTDVDAVYAGWGTSDQRAIRRAHPDALAETEFAAGSMAPKVRAACSFAEETGGLAAIGSIFDTPALLRGEAGTIISRDAVGIEYGVAANEARAGI
jgi:carbamate kinase